jgi:flagellar biosynthetic protein FliR
VSTLNLVSLPLHAVLLTLLAFARVGGLLQSMPLLSLNNVPVPIRAGLALTVASLATASLPAAPELEQLSGVGFGLCFASEALLGLAMGFSVAMQFDPLSGGQSLVVTRILQIGALLTFLGLDLHHELVLGVVDSFSLAAPGQGVLAFAGAESAVLRFGGVLHDAVRISMPVVATALFVNLVAALVTRFAQQMNIYFSVGLAAQAPIGLLATSFVIPAALGVVASLSGNLRGLLPVLVG